MSSLLYITSGKYSGFRVSGFRVFISVQFGQILTAPPPIDITSPPNWYYLPPCKFYILPLPKKIDYKYNYYHQHCNIALNLLSITDQLILRSCWSWFGISQNVTGTHCGEQSTVYSHVPSQMLRHINSHAMELLRGPSRSQPHQIWYRTRGRPCDTYRCYGAPNAKKPATWLSKQLRTN